VGAGLVTVLRPASNRSEPPGYLIDTTAHQCAGSCRYRPARYSPGMPVPADMCGAFVGLTVPRAGQEEGPSCPPPTNSDFLIMLVQIRIAQPCFA
jgi:hypothetical protein